MDNSFEVLESTQRIAIQNGKVIILKYETNGVYHGYTHEDLKTLSGKVKDTLIENGFLKDATAKKINYKIKVN